MFCNVNENNLMYKVINRDDEYNSFEQEQSSLDERLVPVLFTEGYRHDETD